MNNNYLSESYNQGWNTPDDKPRAEHYAAILNDLSEHVPPKATKAELCEVLGWLQKRNCQLIAHINRTHDSAMQFAMAHIKAAHDWPEIYKTEVKPQ